MDSKIEIDNKVKCEEKDLNFNKGELNIGFYKCSVKLLSNSGILLSYKGKKNAFRNRMIIKVV